MRYCLKSNAPKIDILKSDPIGKFIIFTVSNTRDVIVNIYAPSGVLKEKQEQRQNFFHEISNLIDKYTNREDNILLGDFNTTFGPPDESSGEI